MTNQTNTRTTGLDLKLARTAARLKAKHVAEAMGISSSRIAAIEREAIVTPQTAARYRSALAQCGTHGTETAA